MAAAVVPEPAVATWSPQADLIPLPPSHRLSSIAGCLYLLFTLASSVFYLTLLSPHVSNDFWWPDFNSTGLQTFLADVFNGKIYRSYNGSLNVFSTQAAIASLYNDAATYIKVRPSYVRSILLSEISIRDAVTIIRRSSFDNNMVVLVSFCWVDLNRTFELALSALRQQRCTQKYLPNGAVYLESMTRNVVIDTIISSVYLKSMSAAIFVPMNTTEAGRAWISAFVKHEWLPIEEEVNVWNSKGIQAWQVPANNLFTYGIDNSISIVNALGMQQTITINKFPYGGNDVSLWTTRVANSGLWNIMTFVTSLNMTNLRQFPDHFETKGVSWDSYVAVPDSYMTFAVRNTLGPYGSMDITLVPVPRALLRAYDRFLEHLLSAMQILEPDPLELGLWTVDPIPPEWRVVDMFYLGGNPLCAQNTPLAFVQGPFSLDDPCQMQAPFNLTVTRPALLFAIVTTQFNLTDTAEACSMCYHTEDTCTAMLLSQDSIIDILYKELLRDNEFWRMLKDALMEVRNVRPIFYQYGVVNNVVYTLSQPLVAWQFWSLYGWVMLANWADGWREVFLIEGDIKSLVLISELSSPLLLAAKENEIPTSASNYVWFTSMYVSVVLGIIGALVLLHGIINLRLRFCGYNLMFFHHVAGSVWVGRSFMILRGAAAVFVLSTCPIQLVRHGEMSLLEWNRRSWLSTLAFASECSWLSYAMCDFLLPFLSSKVAKKTSIATTVLGWAAIVLWESLAPFQATANVQESCEILHMGIQVNCISGSFEIGSLTRAWQLVALQVGCLALSLLLFMLLRLRDTSKDSHNLHIAVPSSSQVFLSYSRTTISVCMDEIACILSGFLPFFRHLVDFKLLLPSHSTKAATGVMFHSKKVEKRAQPPVPPPRRKNKWRIKLEAAVGLSYMLSSVWGSYTYLNLTRSKMVNDFWWASFNSSGMQSYLIMAINRQLWAYEGVVEPFALDDVALGDWTRTYDVPNTIVDSAELYPSSIQDSVNTIPNVIHGLREMDPCLAMWISTAYCYVDFEQRWELAFSASKQQRCRQNLSNGAVYLEAILRNVGIEVLSVCFQSALDVAVLSWVSTDASGKQWVEQTRQRVTEQDEVKHWQSHNVTYFETEWQNFKQLGLIDTFRIHSAFGISYTLTLKHSNGSFRLDSATALKMPWNFALALHAVVGMGGNTSITGRNLVRSAPNYAFKNASITRVLIETLESLHMPTHAGYVLLQNQFGPFGTLSLRRVQLPRELKALLASWTGILMRHQTQNATFQYGYSVAWPYILMAPRPHVWKQYKMFYGGSFLCDSTSTAVIPLVSFTSMGACSSNIEEHSRVDVVTAFFALAALALENASLDNVCAQDEASETTCKRYFADVMPYVQDFTLLDDVQHTEHQLEPLRTTLLNDIHLMQYVHNASTDSVELVMEPIFRDAMFEYYAWVYMFQWANGLREVVQLEGDWDSRKFLSTITTNKGGVANSAEIPMNVATYTRMLLQYITRMLAVIATLASVYIVTTRGHVEMWNVLQLNRVAGLVWIGHPLLLLRGLTAVALLSTSGLSLTRKGSVTWATSTPTPWLTTLFSSGEMGWCVYLVNDVFSLLAGDVTTAYGWKHPAMVWLLASIWGSIWPVEFHATLDRQCEIVAVDFQATCNSAVIAIGRFERFLGLLAVVLVCGLVCFLADRRYKRTCVGISSSLLPASAFYMFEMDAWAHNGVMYIDKASAVIAGVLTVEFRHKIYGLEVKKWRTFTIDVGDFRSTLQEESVDRFRQAIPLLM